MGEIRNVYKIANGDLAGKRTGKTYGLDGAELLE
jgi:hypothetical protein